MISSDLPRIHPKAVHNECLNLTANVLNTVAGATATVGVLTPFTAYVLDLQGIRVAGLGPVLLLAVGWFAFGACLHWPARRTLGDLR